VLQKGQELQVKVLSIEEGGRRIGLGVKQLGPDPWQEAAERLSEGAVVTGKVVRLMDFGAFVELFPGVEGLVHVSQLKPDRVRRPNEAVSVGDEVGVRVLSVDPVAKRISLSRMDERGAVIGSEDSVEGAEIDRVLRESPQRALGTNLGSLFRKALEGGGEPG
jgi:ribosomal protein S1